MFSLALLLLILVAVTGAGVMSVFMYSVLTRLRQLESGSMDQPREIGSSQLDQMSEEIAIIRGQLEQLEQRTEFHERLLENRLEQE